MNNTQLVQVFTGEIRGEPVQLCNARELHTFIESRQQFADWIKNRVEQYGFVEGEDFFINLGKSTGGRRSKEYDISLDMAKELAMVENNDKGRMVRRYFIGVEKRARESFMRGLPSIGQQLSAHRVLMRLPDLLEHERHPLKRELLKGQIDHACRILGIAIPNLDAIGHAEEPQSVPAIVDAFWEAVEMIGIEKLNHARVAGTIAINLIHFQKVADEAGIKAPPLEPLRRVLRLSESPRFRSFKSVNSALLDRSVKCWVFEEEAPAQLSPLH